MTYQPAGNLPKRTSVAFFSWTHKASQQVGQSFDVSLLSHTWSTAPVVTSGDTITLSKGHYFAQAFVSATRTVASHNARFIFSVDGASVGKFGQTDMYDNFQTDTADCEFTIQDGSVSFRLDLIGIEDSLPSITSNSRIVLWRVEYAGA